MIETCIFPLEDTCVERLYVYSIPTFTALKHCIKLLYYNKNERMSPWTHETHLFGGFEPVHGRHDEFETLLRVVHQRLPPWRHVLRYRSAGTENVQINY